MAATGFCNDHTSGTAAVPRFPNSVRTACTSDDSGFHSAIPRSQSGRVSEGTKALLTKEVGNSTIMPALLTDWGLGTATPSSSITQLKHHAVTSRSSTPRRKFPTPAWKRQPTTKPAMSITNTEHAATARSARVRAIRIALGAMGRVRNRSMIPSLRSSAM